MTIAPEAPHHAAVPVAGEITARCQLTCPKHCYAEAGPTRGHGSMTGDDWHRAIVMICRLLPLEANHDGVEVLAQEALETGAL